MARVSRIFRSVYVSPCCTPREQTSSKSKHKTVLACKINSIWCCLFPEYRLKAVANYKLLSILHFAVGFLLLFFATYILIEIHGQAVDGTVPYYTGAFMTGFLVSSCIYTVCVAWSRTHSLGHLAIIGGGRPRYPPPNSISDTHVEPPTFRKHAG